jgi:hypothetical protein
MEKMPLIGRKLVSISDKFKGGLSRIGSIEEVAKIL